MLTVPRTGALLEQIEGCCREMVEIRHSEGSGSWADSNGKGLVTSCEALLCFLLPARAVPNRASLFVDTILTRESLTHSLDEIADLAREDFPGTPYINFARYSRDGRDHGFIDGVAFCTSVILSAAAVAWEALPKTLQAKLRSTFERALTFLADSNIEGKGWSWGTYGKPREPFLYATWTTLETIDDLTSQREIAHRILPDSDKLISVLSQQRERARDYLISRHLTKAERSTSPFVNLDATQGVISFGQDDASLYYNLWAVMSLLLSGIEKQAAIAKAMDVILAEMDRKLDKYRAATFHFSLDGTELVAFPQFMDRAFLPLALKAFAIWLAGLPEGELLGSLPAVERLYALLLENRDDKQRRFVWDRFADRDTGYAIYYTERAIEGLCRLYRLSERLEASRLGEALDILSQTAGEAEWHKTWASIGEQLRGSATLHTRVDELQSRIADFEKRLNQIEGFDPGSAAQRAQEVEESLRTIEIHRRNGRVAEALREVRMALEKHPGNRLLAREREKLEGAAELLDPRELRA
jgi:hypothetical protein